MRFNGLRCVGIILLGVAALLAINPTLFVYYGYPLYQLGYTGFFLALICGAVLLSLEREE